nr:hypothetical protein [uncultured Acinetobacter sp.]
MLIKNHKIILISSLYRIKIQTNNLVKISSKEQITNQSLINFDYTSCEVKTISVNECKILDIEFNFHRKNIIGIIILLENIKTTSFENLKTYLKEIKKYTKNISIGVLSNNKKHMTSLYRNFMIKNNYKHPIFFSSTSTQDFILLLIETLISNVVVNLGNHN